MRVPWKWKKETETHKKEEEVLSLAKSTKIERSQLTLSQSCPSEGSVGDHALSLVAVSLESFYHCSSLAPSKRSPTVRHFLACTDESFVIFTPFSSQKDYPNFQFQKGPFSTIGKRIRKKTVSISWKLKRPKRLAEDSEIREDLALHYFVEHYGTRFQSCFGICIWDYARLNRFKSPLLGCEWASDWDWYIY